MVIFCDGMVRSGSTWAYNIALKLLRASDFNRKVFGFYNEDPRVLMAAVRPRFSHLVIKSHVLDPSSYQLCCTEQCKPIYTWRNPYDVVVSCKLMFGSTTEHWIAVLRKALRVWAFHLETGSACIIPYEAVVKEPGAAVARIAAYLGLPIEQERVRQIAEEVSFENVKRFSQRINELRRPRLICSGGYVFDRETLLHQNHIRNGGIGYGAEILEAGHLLAIDQVLEEEGFTFLCQPHGAAASLCDKTFFSPALESPGARTAR